MKYLFAVLLSIALLAAPAHADTCRQQCVGFCQDNGRGAQCYTECAQRPLCPVSNAKLTGKLTGNACRNWCDVHRQGGTHQCYADCDSRR
jgi:hypothetical protein